MATGKTYSVRFLALLGGGGGMIWYCPTGKRAVVQTLTMVNNGSASGTLEVSIDTALVALLAAPAKSDTQRTNLRMVVYAGEGLKVVGSVANLYATAHGYLFDDTGGLSDVGEAEAIAGAGQLPA